MTKVKAWAGMLPGDKGFVGLEYSCDKVSSSDPIMEPSGWQQGKNNDKNIPVYSIPKNRINLWFNPSNLWFNSSNPS